MPQTTLYHPPGQQRHLIPTSLTGGASTVAVIFGTNYSISLTGLAANTLYFLYWTGSALVFNTTVPSSYITLANPTYYLIGAFYSNGNSSVGFGSYVNIIGSPSTGVVPFVPVVRTNTGGGVANFSVAPTGYWMRTGGKLYWNAGFAVSSGGLTGTAGALIINGPTNLNGSQGGVSDGVLGSLAGHWNAQTGTTLTGGAAGSAFYVFTGTDVSLMKNVAAVIQLADCVQTFNPLVQIEVMAFTQQQIIEM